MKSKALDRVDFDAATLMKTHPPQWRHRNKQAVFRSDLLVRLPLRGTDYLFQMASQATSLDRDGAQPYADPSRCLHLSPEGEIVRPRLAYELR